MGASIDVSRLTLDFHMDVHEEATMTCIKSVEC